MTHERTPQDCWGGSFSRRRFLQGAAGGVAGLTAAQFIAGADPAQAAVQCPHPNPIVNENRCVTAGVPAQPFAFQLQDHDGNIRGFATRTTYGAGETVQLKLSSFDQGSTSAELQVYRLGYYGGKGGRLVHSNPSVALVNQGFFDPLDSLGYTSGREAWDVSASFSTAGFVSGMYLVKVVANTGGETHIPFILRDDNRNRDLLVAMPTNTWLAYNNWTQKSLYNYNSFGADTVTQSRRAAKVSFNAPLSNVLNDYNWVLRTEFPLIFWLERMGYDMAYTDDVGLHSQPAQLRPPKTKTLVIAGHSEYWTRDAFDNVKAARDAGTNIASFSANTAYWQVRYEDEGPEPNRAMACFKTVQGNNITSDNGDVGDQRLGCNDFGPGATGASRGGPNDPLGPNGTAPNSDDKPQFATTTFRDGGSPPASAGGNGPNDPQRGVGRPRVAKSENELFGVLYIGDDDVASYPLGVPAGSGSVGEFGAHPAWRHTSVANRAGAEIGSNLVGWEWDAIPKGTGNQPNAPYVARQPSGVKRLAQTNVTANPPGNAEIEYLKDEGHTYGAAPPAGQGPEVHAVTYEAQSGALVFAAGTIQWSWGLGPHFLNTFLNNYMEPPTNSSDSRIQQATFNLLVDGGVKPSTPEGVIMDTAPKPPPKPPGMPATPKPTAPSKDTKPPTLSMPRRSRRLGRDGRIPVTIKVPRTETSAVEGSVTLFALVSRGRGKRRRRVKLGSGYLQASAGKTARLPLKLSRRRRSALAKQGVWRIEVVAKVRDQAGNFARLTSSFRLLAPRRRRRTRS